MCDLKKCYKNDQILLKTFLTKFNIRPQPNISQFKLSLDRSVTKTTQYKKFPPHSRNQFLSPLPHIFCGVEKKVRNFPTRKRRPCVYLSIAVIGPAFAPCTPREKSVGGSKKKQRIRGMKIAGYLLRSSVAATEREGSLVAVFLGVVCAKCLLFRDRKGEYTNH